MFKPCSRKISPGHDDVDARRSLVSILSRYLHEPGATVTRLLQRNRAYIHEVDQFRNHHQRHSRLDKHLASFQLQQRAALDEVLQHSPGSRILASYHFGDFIYGNNIVAACEGPGRRQCYLTQLPATEAFLANMSYCFGEHVFQSRKQFTTDAISPMSLVRKLNKEKCTLLTFVDLPPGFGERIRVSFLGREAWFPKGPAVLSLASGAPLLPVLNCRREISNRIQLFPMIMPCRAKGESLSQACARMTQSLVNILEEALLNNPWQWRFLPSLPAYFSSGSRQES